MALTLRSDRSVARVAVVAAGLALFAASCGGTESQVEPAAAADDVGHEDQGTHDSDVSAPDVVIAVEMSEFEFSHETLEVDVGTVVRFDFVNNGVVEHEAVIGDLEAQGDAEAAMAAMAPDDDHDGDAHGAAPSIILAPGESGSLTVAFEHAGEVVIGCHVPGHWDAGMRSSFTVA